jgi:hypothetical protein
MLRSDEFDARLKLDKADAPRMDHEGDNMAEHKDGEHDWLISPQLLEAPKSDELKILVAVGKDAPVSARLRAALEELSAAIDESDQLVDVKGCGSRCKKNNDVCIPDWFVISPER